MDILSAIMAGIIQGATEFLPVSSSGHLALYRAFSGADFDGAGVAFDVFLHLGTLFAVCAVYRKDVSKLIRGCFSGLGKLIRGKAGHGFDEYERLAFYVFVATLPLALLALLGADDAVEAASLHPAVIGAALICTGFVLLFSEKAGGGMKTLSEITLKSALAVGVCQAAAIMPGLSRSGCTVSGGLLNKFDRESAVRFSFLISIPAIIGANVLKLPAAVSDGAFSDNVIYYITGFVSSALSGFLSIKLLVFITKKAKLSYFSYYCFALGAFAVIYEIFNLT